MPIIQGNKPDCVGDIPDLTITYTDPTGSGQTVTAVTGQLCRPDGTTMTATPATQTASNTFRWVGAPIDQASSQNWSLKLTATGTLADVSVLTFRVQKTAFDV